MYEGRPLSLIPILQGSNGGVRRHHPLKKVMAGKRTLIMGTAVKDPTGAKKRDIRFLFNLKSRIKFFYSAWGNSREDSCLFFVSTWVSLARLLSYPPHPMEWYTQMRILTIFKNLTILKEILCQILLHGRGAISLYGFGLNLFQDCQIFEDS